MSRSRRTEKAYTKFIANICIGLQLSVMRTTAVASNETTMFIFYRVLTCNVGVDYSP